MGVYRCDISDTVIGTALNSLDNVQLSSRNIPRVQQPYPQRLDVAEAEAEAADVDAVAAAEEIGTTLTLLIQPTQRRRMRWPCTSTSVRQ